MEYLAEHHRHALGMRSRRQESKVLAFPVDQENERGMVDGVAFALRHLFVEHLIARRDAPRLLLAAAQREEARMERGGVFAQHLGAVALRVEGDEERLHRLG